MRRGWKTTEFWGVLLLNVGTVTASLSGNLPPKYAALVGAVSASVYAVARAITKLGDPALNGTPAERVTATTLAPK